MNYITAASITLTYTITPAQAANSVLAQYHVEAHDLTTGIRKNVAAATVTAAIAPVVGVSAGTPGSVSFTGVPTVSTGAHAFKVFYADAADLDTAGMTLLGGTLARKIGAVSTIAL